MAIMLLKHRKFTRAAYNSLAVKDENTEYSVLETSGEFTRYIGDKLILKEILDSKLNISEKNQNDGYAGLDSSGKIPESILPASILGSVKYIGTWNPTTNTPTLPAAGSSNFGHYYKASITGTHSGVEYRAGDWIISDGTIWDKVDNTDNVVSVNGKDGVVVLVKSDIGLGNVDNTSDADKPLSTAQGAAIGLKANIASPTFTGEPKAPTPSTGDNSTKIATTAFVSTAMISAGLGDMLKSIYDSNDDGVVDNAEKVNGFTVGTDVPANAEFTDTKYTHPTSAGNKHIPTGGASGNFLKYSASGTAVWASPTKSDVGLSNVDNTSDMNKPVSGPQELYINGILGDIQDILENINGALGWEEIED